jgi:hypothetical protein
MLIAKRHCTSSTFCLMLALLALFEFSTCRSEVLVAGVDSAGYLPPGQLAEETTFEGSWTLYLF